MINDCEFDFYGLRLATCDNKGFVHIVNAENEQGSAKGNTFF
jgi:hypothetical protein